MSYKFNEKKYKTIVTLKTAMKKKVKELNETLYDIGRSPVDRKSINSKKVIIRNHLNLRNDIISNLNNPDKFKIKVVKVNKKIVNVNNKVDKRKKTGKEFINFNLSLYKIKDKEKKHYKNHEHIIDKNGTEHVRMVTLNMHMKKKYMEAYMKILYRFVLFEHNGIVSLADFQTSMMKDKKNKYLIENLFMSGGVSGFKILNYNITHNKPYNEYDAFKESYKLDSEEKTIDSKYTSYKLNKNAIDFKDCMETEKNEYVQNNFHKNSCFMTAIINKFYDKFNMKTKDGKRIYKELTYEYLADILKIKYKSDGEMELTIKDVVDNFFKKFNSFAALKIYDSFMNLIFHHENTNKDKTILLRVMVKGNHIYELNNNNKSLSKIESVKIDTSDKVDIKISNKFHIIDFNEEKQAKTKVKFLKTCDNFLNKLMLKMQQYTAEKKYDVITFVTEICLGDLVIDVVESGYVPKIFFNNFIYKMSFVVKVGKKNILINIQCVDDDPVYGQLINNGDMIIDSKKTFDKFNKTYENLYTKIMKPEYLSEYNEDTINILDTYTIQATVGSFEETTENHDIIDMNKAYTNQLMKIKEVPVFKYFDVFMNYTDEKIEKYNEYIIEIVNNKKSLLNIFKNKHSRIYGFVLLKLNTNDFKIHKFRKPSFIKEVDFETPINELYDTDLQTEIKKHLVNKLTGVLEQKNNKSHLTKIFKNYDEALYYSIKYNALAPRTITKYFYDITIEIDENGNKIECCKTNNKKDKYLYIVNIEEKKRLVNGFQPIKDIIYQMQQLQMYELYVKLKLLDFEIYGTKTDCFYIKGDNKLLSKNFNINNEIGNYKIEINKVCPTNPLQYFENELIKFKDFEKINIKTFKDEYNVKSTTRYLKSVNNCMIKGEFPGVGKSTLCKNLDKDSLFICPTNRLCQNIRSENFSSHTFHHLFGVIFNPNQDEKNDRKSQLDISQYKTVVFDEIFLYPPDRLKKIDILIRNNPNIKFLATGDTRQRKPVGFDDAKYINHCIDCIFDNVINLSEMKRVSTKEDKESLKGMRTDLFETNMSVDDICKKYKLKTISTMQQVKTKKNIAYFNKHRTEPVNNYVHFKLLKNKEKYTVGQEIICKEHMQKKKFVLHTNYSYKVIKIDNNKAFIKDELENETYEITLCELMSKFSLPYCFTCDSMQGLSFDKEDKVTIFDSNIPHTDREYFWTAITRTRQLKNVTVFIHPQKDVEQLRLFRMNKYLQIKIEGYKSQDKKKNRIIEPSKFVDVEWFKYKLIECKFQCKFCQERMNFEIDDGKFQSNITLDRIDNKLAHTKQNCQVCCLNCNIRKK